MNREFLSALAVLVALAAVVAGCGGGDSTTDSTRVVLTKTEFIKQGEAICREATEKNQSEAEDFAKENDFELEKASKDQLEEAIAEVIAPSLGKQAEELDALGAPRRREAGRRHRRSMKRRREKSKTTRAWPSKKRR